MKSILELNIHRIKIPYAIFTPFLYFKPLQRRKKFFFFFSFFFFSSINPSIIAFSTLALLTEPQRLDARLSDVHFIEPPGTLACTRLSLARIAAQTSNEQNDESTSRWIYSCRVNRVARSGNRPLVSIKFLIKLRTRGLIRDGTNLLWT